MHPFNKIIAFALIVFLSAGFYACVPDGNSQNGVTSVSNPLIPKLLDRNEKIWYGKEWENVQNAYAKEAKAISNNPQAKEPWLNLAEIFIQEARVTGEHPHYYPAALQVLGVLLAKGFDEKDMRDTDLKFRGLSAKASVELSQHEFAKALATAEEAVKLNPYNSTIYGALVDANVELGRYDEAVKMADKMVSIRPDLRSYSRVSYLREIHGDVPGAIEAMEMAVQAGYPGADNTSWAMVTLGGLYLQYGKMAEAEQTYQTVLATRADFPFALGGLAQVEIERKNYAAAETYLSKAIDIMPEVGFYEKRAVVYRETGRKAEFEKTVQEVLAMMKDDQAHGHNMDLEFAKVYSDLANDPKKGLEYAQKEFKNRPDNISVNGVLAEIYFKLGDAKNGQAHLDRALRTGSKNPDYLALK
ncbi:MAG: tetratricopeptide repeat protein [Bacteroidetes bacterium]|nr:tetratricopeptide repeat protein [Bacteroidota bacterium]